MPAQEILFGRRPYALRATTWFFTDGRLLFLGTSLGMFPLRHAEPLPAFVAFSVALYDSKRAVAKQIALTVLGLDARLGPLIHEVMP